jgi:hypothetical protein
MTREWYRWFYNIFTATGGTTQGVIQPEYGGTGSGVVPKNGELLIGNTVTGTYDTASLGTGPGIGKTVGTGSLSIENTGVLSNIAGDGISVDQATGDVTITNDGVLSIIAGDGISVDQATGDVTVTNDGVLSFSGGTTGLTPSVATTGDVVLAGTLDVDNGGTGQTSYTDGQLLIGNTTGNTLAKSTLTAGTGISVTNGAGSITVATTGASGSFTTVDLKTVTVVNGIITSIV